MTADNLGGKTNHARDVPVNHGEPTDYGVFGNGFCRGEVNAMGDRTKFKVVF